MARRSAPPGSGPSYMAPSYGGGARGQLADPHESWLARTYREQVVAPQHLPGNISILGAVALFAGGIFAIPHHYTYTFSQLKPTRILPSIVASALVYSSLLRAATIMKRTKNLAASDFVRFCLLKSFREFQSFPDGFEYHGQSPIGTSPQISLCFSDESYKRRIVHEFAEGCVRKRGPL
ncbi:hypothetical protein DFH11DRAFT_1615617 [Phellopilus nigrolimitatus]|nr:hypothetical protein DFH11DRAFT_1615617 [Phellopilus nigrolimitatus]